MDIDRKYLLKNCSPEVIMDLAASLQKVALYFEEMTDNMEDEIVPDFYEGVSNCAKTLIKSLLQKEKKQTFTKEA